MSYSNRQGSRGRQSFLLLIKGDEIVAFAGETIENIVVVRGSDYKKDGKWSHTTYRLETANGVRQITGADGWETGRFTEGIGSCIGCKTPDTWKELSEAMGVSVPSVMKFLRGWRPSAAEKLDETEVSLQSLEEASGNEDSVRVTVSFGGPTNREIREGFWISPKPIPGYEADVQLINPEVGWINDNVKVVGISGTIISISHSNGMHGGYYAVEVAVIPDTEESDQTESSDDAKPDGALGMLFKKAGIR